MTSIREPEPGSLRPGDLHAELERALRSAGAKPGATVEVGDEEFELA